MKYVQNGNWAKKRTKLAYDICDYKFLYYSRNEVIYEILRHMCQGMKPYKFYEYYMK